MKPIVKQTTATLESAAPAVRQRLMGGLSTLCQWQNGCLVAFGRKGRRLKHLEQFE